MRAQNNTQSTICPLLDDFTDGHNGVPVIRDVHQARITGPSVTNARDALNAFFNSAPRSVVALLRLRNAILGPLGFATGDGTAPAVATDPRPGDRIGVFTIMECRDNETLLGVEDGHISMRLSVAVNAETTNVALGTAAYANDKTGRVYLTAVKPAHGFIARLFAKRIAAH